MKAALFIVILTFATSALARPQQYDEEYTDNSLSDSIPFEDDSDEERTDYVQM